MNSFRILLFFLILATVFSGGSEEPERRRTRGGLKRGAVEGDERATDPRKPEVNSFEPMEEIDALTVKFCEHHDGTGKCCTLPEGLYEGDSAEGLQTQDYDGNACPGNDALSYVHVYGHCSVTLDTLDNVRYFDALGNHKRPAHERHTIRLTQSGIYRGEKHFPDEQVSSVLIECNLPRDEDASEVVPVNKDNGEDRRHLWEVCHDWMDSWMGIPIDWGFVECGDWLFDDYYCCPFTGTNMRIGSQWGCCPGGTECGSGKCEKRCLRHYEACCENVDQEGMWMQDPPTPTVHKTGLLYLPTKWINTMADVLATYLYANPLDSNMLLLREPWSSGMVCDLGHKCLTGYDNHVIGDVMKAHDLINMESQKYDYEEWWPEVLDKNGVREKLNNYYETVQCKDIRASTQRSSLWERFHSPIRDYLIQCTDSQGFTRTIFNLHVPVCMDKKFWYLGNVEFSRRT